MAEDTSVAFSDSPICYFALAEQKHSAARYAERSATDNPFGILNSYIGFVELI